MARCGGQDLPHARTLPTAKASRHGTRAKEFAPRRNALLGKGLPTRRTSERICPAQEHAPRRRPPDTAHERKDLPHGGSRSPRVPTNGGPLPTDEQPEKHPFGGVAPETAHERKDLPRPETLSSAKASRNGARAKGFVPRRNTPLDEGLPTRRTSERICPRARTRPSAKASRHGARAKRFAPRGSRSPRVPTNGGPLPTDEQPEKHPFGGVAPETAHERKDLPRPETLSSAKASRNGARAKGFVPRRNTPLDEGLPTRRTSERICPRARTRPSAKASRHGARAKRFAPRGSRSPHVPTNGGPPSVDGQPEKHPFGGVAPERARPLPSSFTEKNKTTP